jgi:hypothetical protein
VLAVLPSAWIPLQTHQPRPPKRLGSPPKGARPALRANVVRVGGGVRSPSLFLFVVGVVLERLDLAGEQTPVLGMPIDGRE